MLAVAIKPGTDLRFVCSHCTPVVRWVEPLATWVGMAHVECCGKHRLVSLPPHAVVAKEGDPVELFVPHLQDLVEDANLKSWLADEQDIVKRHLRMVETIKMVMRSRAGERVE